MIMEKIKLENSRAQMKKGVLDFAVLLVVSEGAIYAPDIIVKLKEAGLRVVEGTIYPLLNRLKESEFLEYEWKESKYGPPRKYYQLTNRGRAALRELTDGWNELSKTISNLLKK